MDTKEIPTQEQIMSWLFTSYYDDLDFIEKLNDFTYSRKLQLKSKLKQEQMI